MTDEAITGWELNWFNFIRLIVQVYATTFIWVLCYRDVITTLDSEGTKFFREPVRHLESCFWFKNLKLVEQIQEERRIYSFFTIARPFTSLSTCNDYCLELGTFPLFCPTWCFCYFFPFGYKNWQQGSCCFLSLCVSSLSLTRNIFINFSHAIIFKNKHLLINTLSNFRIY